MSLVLVLLIGIFIGLVLNTLGKFCNKLLTAKSIHLTIGFKDEVFEENKRDTKQIKN
jgi:hypothetical protein